MRSVRYRRDQMAAAPHQVGSVGGDVGEELAGIVRREQNFRIAADAHRDAFQRARGSFRPRT